MPLQNKFSVAVSLAFLALFTLAGCIPVRNEPVIIWTDRAEMASYVELFNSQQQKTQALVVYKSPLVSALRQKMKSTRMSLSAPGS